MTSSPDTKNLGGRPATGQGTPVMVRIQPPQLAALNAYVAAQPEPRLSRPEAIRFLLRDSLVSLGYLPHRDDPEMAN